MGSADDAKLVRTVAYPELFCCRRQIQSRLHNQLRTTSQSRTHLGFIGKHQPPRLHYHLHPTPPLPPSSRMKTSLYKPYAVSTEQRQSFLSPESRSSDRPILLPCPYIPPSSRLIRTHSKGVEGRSSSTGSSDSPSVA